MRGWNGRGRTTERSAARPSEQVGEVTRIRRYGRLSEPLQPRTFLGVRVEKRGGNEYAATRCFPQTTGDLAAAHFQRRVATRS